MLQLPQFNGGSYTAPRTAHRRTNSDHRPVGHSTGEFAEDDLERYLPSFFVDEVSGPLDAGPTPSLEAFETLLSKAKPGEAVDLLISLVENEKDSKEQGKTLRAAAETAKRLFDIPVALEAYRMGCRYDPMTPPSWVDLAKLFDELGEHEVAEGVLQEGVRVVSNCEHILRKLLKSFERSNKIGYARSFLAQSIHSKGVQDGTILVEGALFELRQKQSDTALKLLFLVKEKSGWRPGVYSDLVQYLERCGRIEDALEIAKEGSQLNPRNAVVCQTLLRRQRSPESSLMLLEELRSRWTAEFADKMVIPVAERLAEAGEIKKMRLLLAEACSTCTSRQRHKILIPAAISELTRGDPSIAPLLLDLAMRMTPSKSRPLVLMLMAKVMELSDDYERAEKLLISTTEQYGAEWRVFFELAQFYVHSNKLHEAVGVLERALELHPGSGRLWAFRIQLESFRGVESQIVVLLRAIKSVPKSGEVWCEAARICLNPLTEYFSLESAKLYLDFAYRFTPQHGDTLIEMVRTELLEKGISTKLEEMKQKFICSEGNYGQLFVVIKGIEERPMIDVFVDAVRNVKRDIMLNRMLYARAMARSSFVLPSTTSELARLRRDQIDKNVFSFSCGLTTIGEEMLDSKKCESRQRRLAIVLGTSICSQ